MIKIDDEKLVYDGSKAQLMADLTRIMKELRDDDILNEDDINLCIEVSKKSEDELKSEVRKNIMKFLDELFKD